MRIASLQPSVTVTLSDLGRLDSLVACTKYCADVCPEVRSAGLKIIQDSWSAKAEEILSATPDLVIAAVPYRMEAVAEIMRAGIRFLGLAPKSLNDVYGDIRMIAGVAEASDAGEDVVERMKAAIREMQERTAALRRPAVFVEEWGKPIIASQPWVAELVEAAGGSFLGSPGMQVEAKAVAESAPEVIVAAWCGAGDRVPLEKMVSERNWDATPAAKSGRVFCISDELLNTPASTLLGGLRALAWAIHPEEFERPAGIRQIGKPRS